MAEDITPTEPRESYLPIRIDIDGYRISGDWKGLAVSRIRAAKTETKSHAAGDMVESDSRYYPDVGSACVALARRMTSDAGASSLAAYVERLERAEARIRDLVGGAAPSRAVLR